MDLLQYLFHRKFLTKDELFCLILVVCGIKIILEPQNNALKITYLDYILSRMTICQYPWAVEENNFWRSVIYTVESR